MLSFRCDKAVEMVLGIGTLMATSPTKLLFEGFMLTKLCQCVTLYHRICIGMTIDD